MARKKDDGKSSAPEPRGRTAGILVVDDRSENLETLAAVLKEFDKEVVKARSGQEALRLLFDREFAVILLDVRMPDMDGYETASLIRSRQRSRYTPIIFITAADSSPEEIAKGYSVGAVDYIFKPFMVEVLKAKVRIFLELFKKNEELQASEARFRTLARNIPGAIYRRTAERPWKTQFVSEPIEEISGYPALDFMEGRRSCLDILEPEDVDGFQAALEGALKQLKPYALEYRIRHRDGRLRWVYDRGQTVYPLEAGPRLVDGLILDITDRKIAEEEVRQRTQQLQVAHSELESFSYSVSHDLRAPLRAIDGFSHMLCAEHEDALDGEGKRLLGVIRASTLRMGQLIDDLLSFSRLGRKPLSLVPVSMKSMADSAVSECLAAAGERQVEVKVGELPPLEGDVSALRQVWSNLIENAFKYTRSRPIARIEVEGRVEGAECIYAVKDNGVGFNMEHAQNLFGVFRRLHSVEEFEGTGVGLALVRRIVQRHGGRVWAQGEVGAGAAFFMALPTEGKKNGQS